MRVFFLVFSIILFVGLIHAKAEAVGQSSSVKATVSITQGIPLCHFNLVDSKQILTPFDFNNDCRIEQSELLKAITSWTDSWDLYLENLPPVGPRRICDINQDENCNVLDFSILLFYIDR